MHRTARVATACFIACGVLCPPSAYSQDLRSPLLELPAQSPKDAGLDPDTLQAMLSLVRITPPADFRGLVVIKGGRLVVEEYFHTYWRETIHDVRSAGKSITALLLGIAIDKRLIASEEQRLSEFFPGMRPGGASADAFADITLRHLLTMSSGIDADDADDRSPGQTSRWLNREDWVRYALALPMRSTPGEKWVYTDISPMLIGAVIEKVSGMRLADFAREHLFTPLGIREYYWYTGRGGRTGPMGNLYLSTLDFAKLGQLMLRNGQWQGRQVVSTRWTRALSAQRFDISGTNPFATGYGYMWYQGVRVVNGHKYEYHFASGNGGNVLIVLPELDMVVALTSSAYGQGYGHQRTQNIFESILRSIVRP